jgi:hypothetical protein
VERNPIDGVNYIRMVTMGKIHIEIHIGVFDRFDVGRLLCYALKKGRYSNNNIKPTSRRNVIDFDCMFISLNFKN